MLSLPTYLSFVSVLLTAVTLVLAILAIGIGVLAAYTFKELANIVDRAVTKRADEALSDDRINSRIDEIAFRNPRPDATKELESGFDPSDSGER